MLQLVGVFQVERPGKLKSVPPIQVPQQPCSLVGNCFPQNCRANMIIVSVARLDVYSVSHY